MTFKDALYRELKYGAVLSAFFASAGAKTRIKLDVRLEPEEPMDESNYPWLIFRRIGQEVSDRIGLVKETVEMDIVVRMSGETQNDDVAEQMKEALITEFGGKRKTWGKFTDSGAADPSGGLKMTASHLETQDAFDEDLDEKVVTLTFAFAYVRTE